MGFFPVRSISTCYSVFHHRSTPIYHRAKALTNQIISPCAGATCLIGVWLLTKYDERGRMWRREVWYAVSRFRSKTAVGTSWVCNFCTERSHLAANQMSGPLQEHLWKSTIWRHKEATTAVRKWLPMQDSDFYGDGRFTFVLWSDKSIEEVIGDCDKNSDRSEG